MNNETLLVLSIVVLYGLVLLWYKLFGKVGLYVYVGLITVVANIEVLILVDAFGMEQTLGNVLFASIFLATDILSEKEGKAAANRAVHIGCMTMLSFILISQSWLLYTPSANDWASESFHVLFTAAPRIMVASLVVYAISQKLDVWLYHAIWKATEKATLSRDRLLWVRNNGSTLTSQLVNTVLYNVLAFAGTYDVKTLISIIVAGYVIYIVTSICDTPALYIARRMKVQDAEKAMK